MLFFALFAALRETDLSSYHFCYMLFIKCGYVTLRVAFKHCTRGKGWNLITAALTQSVLLLHSHAGAWERVERCGSHLSPAGGGSKGVEWHKRKS